MTPSAPVGPQIALQQQCGEWAQRKLSFHHSSLCSTLQKGSSDCTELLDHLWLLGEGRLSLTCCHSMKQITAGSGSPGRNRATGSPRKLHMRAMHQASSGLSCCLTQYRAGKLLSRNKCLAEAAETTAGWLGKLLGNLSHWAPMASV